MSDPRRQFLLELYSALRLLPVAEQPAEATRFAASSGLTVRWQGALSEPPHASAVRIAHSLGIGPTGAQLWRAAWGSTEGTAPLPRLAMLVARMLSGREELLVLAAGCGGEAVVGASGPRAGEGILVDGNSCARMAVAGYDVETELQSGRDVALLEAAGDLLYGTGSAAEPAQYLVIGLNLSLAAAPRRAGAPRLEP